MASLASLSACNCTLVLGFAARSGRIQVAAAIQHPSPCCWPLTWPGLSAPGCSSACWPAGLLACWPVGFTLGHKTKIIAALHFIYRSNKYPVNYSKMATTRPREGESGGERARLKYAKVINQNDIVAQQGESQTTRWIKREGSTKQTDWQNDSIDCQQIS